ncbi:hypothetical protein N7466_001923 [Penicillium verhagenii]|uniref:uncharacterized protein n=1 Tax=Penicillium verhagenii TaxID=1562060 RepID=UPI0025453E01|nr:uncharacterized protein N7466_001923 [Penicillium verhagenii]KAJ5938789.1 hypothetical protein N7466_001923 [Penicillium verhagenii]
MPPPFTPAALQALETLPLANIYAQFDHILFGNWHARGWDVEHSEFCAFRQQLLENPRSVRARYPNTYAALRFWMALPATVDLFLENIRWHPNDTTLIPLITGAAGPARITAAMRAAPTVLEPCDDNGITTSSINPDFVTHALIGIGCTDCVKALMRWNILPLDNLLPYTETGCSLFWPLLSRREEGGLLAEEKFDAVMGLLMQLSGPGGQAWKRSYCTIVGIPTIGPYAPPLGRTVFEMICCLGSAKSLEQLEDWHESHFGGIPDPRIYLCLGPQQYYFMCKKASVRVAEWIRWNSGVALSHGALLWNNRTILGKNSWHALARNPAGEALFDHFISFRGTPWRAQISPSQRCMMTDFTPIGDAIRCDRPRLVRKFANHMPLFLWQSYSPRNVPDFLTALVMCTPGSPESWFHVIGNPAFRVWTQWQAGSQHQAISALAFGVVDWYYWNFMMMTVAALIFALTVGVDRQLENKYRVLREVASKKLAAALHYAPASWFGTPDAARLRTRCQLFEANRQLFLHRILGRGYNSVFLDSQEARDANKGG